MKPTAGLIHPAKDQRRGQTPATAQPIEGMIRETHRVLTNCGLTVSPSKVSRLVRTYRHKVEAKGFPFADYIANNITMHAVQRQAVADELHRVISYADPTGETAVRNVMRGANLVAR